MANDHANYSLRINEMLGTMPDFVSDFIYNFGEVEKYGTKFEYCRDIRDFLMFMCNYMPEHSEKSIQDISLNDLCNVKPLDINRYLTLLAGNSDKPLKQTTVKRRRASLSSMYSFLVANGKAPRNPVQATKTIRIPNKNVIYLTNEEQSILLDCVRYGTDLRDQVAKRHTKYADRDSAMFLLLLDTGLRVSEMLESNISDYNLEEHSVIVRRKGGDIQTVYYSDECGYYLKIYFDAQRSKYLTSDTKIPAFTTTTGNRLGVRSVETLVKKYAEACLPEKARLLSPHKLRSSFAMSFYEASDKDILLLQKKLNHKSITTTNIYAKASDEAMRESRGILEGLR